MASQTRLSTPPTQTLVPPAAPTPPTTGTWRHPRLDEISRRQRAKTFGPGHVRKILINLFCFGLSFLLPHHTPFGSMSKLDPSYQTAASYASLILRTILILNVVHALRPFFGQKDDLSDIPLTPNQRMLLGLGPSSAPATPGSSYSTPPRYARSSTPRSTSSRAAVAGSSPFGRSASGSPMGGSPLAGPGVGGSPFATGLSTPGSASPLVRKAVDGKRWSLGGGTPGVVGLEESTTSLPATPSPTAGQRGVSVSLNNKWLYQRQKGSPSGRSMFF